MTRVAKVLACFGVVCAAVIGWAVDVAHACPSCASPLEENRQAFVDTTIFLSLAPLVMIGGLAWWIRRKVRDAEQEQRIQVPENLLRDIGSFGNEQR